MKVDMDGLSVCLCLRLQSGLHSVVRVKRDSASRCRFPTPLSLPHNMQAASFTGHASMKRKIKKKGQKEPTQHKNQKHEQKKKKKKRKKFKQKARSRSTGSPRCFDLFPVGSRSRPKVMLQGRPVSREKKKGKSEGPTPVKPRPPGPAGARTAGEDTTHFFFTLLEEDLEEVEEEAGERLD